MAFISLIAVLYIFFSKGGTTFRDKMLLLPQSFGASPEDELALEVSSTEEVLDLSRIAVAFALEHGADKKRALSFGLITEELSVFFAEHGFNDGKPHHIYIRLVAKNDDLIVRMRDDCKPFNITEYYEMMQKIMRRI